MSKLPEAIEYAKSGNIAKARQLLNEVVEREPNNELAWLWMAGLVEKIDQQVYCLRQALRINPNNQNASQKLSQLTSQSNQTGSDCRLSKAKPHFKGLGFSPLGTRTQAIASGRRERGPSLVVFLSR